MKKFIKFALASVVVAFAGFGIYQNMPQENTLSDFALENIEALSDSESEFSEKKWYRHDYTMDNGMPAVNCYRGGNLDCILRG